MSDDFENAFNEAVAEVEANPDTGSDSNLPPQATIHMGDDEDGGVDETSEGESESGDPEVEGEVSDGNESDDENDEPDEGSGFDWTAHKDDLVTLKVRGQDIQVPLGEALNGYLRHDDYTRKTQELAGMRKMVDAANQMRDALQNDPEGTIKALIAAYGVDVSENPADDPYHTDDPDLQPVMARLKAAEQRAEAQNRQLEAQQREFAEKAILAEVRSEMEQVKAEFPDFDPVEVLPVAAAEDVSIRKAYLMVQGEKSLQSKATTAKAAAKAQEVAKIATAKRKASNTTNKGTSGRATVPKDVSETFDSFEELFMHELELAS